MTGTPAVAALQTADGMGSAVIFTIADVEDAGSGSVPRASVIEFLCFLNLSSFLKMVFMLSESWCSKRGDKVAVRKKEVLDHFGTSTFQLRSVSDPSFSLSLK